MIDIYYDNSPIRRIKAKVELYNGSTLLASYSYTDRLISFDVERVGEEGKFFGFGVITKANIKLIDAARELDITTANSFTIGITNEDNYYYPWPKLYVTEVHRDENTNELSITAYDLLYKVGNQPITDLNLGTTYTAGSVALSLSEMLHCGIETYNTNDNFIVEYPNGANFEGTETIRQALDALAEVTQTIYYMNSNNSLVIKGLDKDGEPVLTIDKTNYFNLESGDNKRLTSIVSATELGDNVEAKLEITGTTQVIRDNPFLELREDIATILDVALAATGGMIIGQFDCTWRGNYGLEPGDKIAIVNKENENIISYVINDTISYNGGLEEKTSWKYTESEAATSTNPTTLGEALNKTFARVDKVNKEVSILASQTEANSEAIATIALDTGKINLSVEQLQTTTREALETLEGNIETVKQKTDLILTPEEVEIIVKNEVGNGVDNVTTSKGFTFDNNGLLIQEEDAEGNRTSATATQITENGMQVFNNEDEAVLTAKDTGVDAVNLHATTYLIIGNYSRFEDYGERTGCFWIKE